VLRTDAGPIGVRPSSGAASSLEELEVFDAEVESNDSAPEDGRTPIDNAKKEISLPFR